MMKILKNRYFVILISLTIFTISIGTFYLLQIQQKNPTMPDSLDCPDCNVIMISLTTVGANHLSLYGYNRETDTNIKKFAKESLIFDNAFTHSSQTVSAGLSMFTSLYPYSHKIVNRVDETPLDSNITTLAEVLKKNNYKTAAFTAGWDYGRKRGYGFDRGFDEYIDTPDDKRLESNIPLAINFLKENKKNKFFMFLQSYDAHCPYNAPAIYEKLYDPNYKGGSDSSQCYYGFNDIEKNEKGEKIYRVWTSVRKKGQTRLKEITLRQEDIDHTVALYDGEIKYNDALLKKIFDSVEKLNLSKKTIIVLLSEHGDIIGDRGQIDRVGPPQGTFYEEVVHIPLIIKHPKINIQKRIDGLVQLIDVMPTIMDFLGIDKKQLKQNMQGQSLLPLILNGKEINSYVYAGSEFKAPNKEVMKNIYAGKSKGEMIRSKKFKLTKGKIIVDFYNKIEKDDYRFFNLKDDPLEKNNLWNLNLPEALEMNRELDEWIKKVSNEKFY